MLFTSARDRGVCVVHFTHLPHSSLTKSPPPPGTFWVTGWLGPTSSLRTLRQISLLSVPSLEQGTCSPRAWSLFPVVRYFGHYYLCVSVILYDIFVCVHIMCIKARIDWKMQVVYLLITKILRKPIKNQTKNCKNGSLIFTWKRERGHSPKYHL